MDTYHLSFIQNYLSKLKQIRQSSKLKPLRIPDRHGLFKKRKFVILFIKVIPEQAWPQQIKMTVSISPFFFKNEYVNFSFRYNIFKPKKSYAIYQLINQIIQTYYFINSKILRWLLTYLCPQCTLPLPSENIRKPYGFLTFCGGRERVHWEQMC